MVVDQRDLNFLVLQRLHQLVSAHKHVHAPLRMHLPEALQHTRQPTARDAREAPHAQALPLQVAALICLPAQHVAGAQHIVHIRHQVFTLHRELHAVARPLQQAAAELRLEFVHHVRHARLRIVQLRGRFGDAAALHCRQQCTQFVFVHFLSNSILYVFAKVSQP